jgi:resuscitation-promoting factor RpfA
VTDVEAADPTLDKLVSANDLDGLVREVDRRTDAEDWDGLVRLRDRGRAAVDRGFQLWPAASLAEYRLALRAPAPWAGAVVIEGAGRFALGPLAEVAASTHEWAELAPHLSDGPLAGMVAHERVVRGEDLSGVAVPFAEVLDLPLRLDTWEPEWPVADYHDDKVVADPPPLPELRPVALPDPVAPVDDADAEAAFRAVVEPWTTQSNGRAEVAAVDGSALHAIATLGTPTARVAEVSPAEALARVAWAAASGGAHGRRRGAAVGRELAWRLGDTLAAGIGRIHDLRWFLWDDELPRLGWHLDLAVDAPDEGVAWAFAAVDQV